MPSAAITVATPLHFTMKCDCGLGFLVFDGSVVTSEGSPAYLHRCTRAGCDTGSVPLDKAYPRVEWVPGCAPEADQLWLGTQSVGNVLGAAKWSGR